MTVGLSAVGVLPGALRELRLRGRAFLEAELAHGTFRPAADAWMSGVDIGFSRRLAARLAELPADADRKRGAGPSFRAG